MVQHWDGEFPLWLGGRLRRWPGMSLCSYHLSNVSVWKFVCGAVVCTVRNCMDLL